MNNKVLISAIRLLSRREYGAAELAAKLSNRGFTEEEAQAAVAECRNLGLQSDSRFVDSITHIRIRAGYGPNRVRQELLTLRIESELIETRLQQEDNHWLEYARVVWKKKFGNCVQTDFVSQQKQKQFLLYRGFNKDTIAQLFKQLARDAFSAE
ncbi:MAG: recombination regulator RecX [Legionella sp.]